MLPKIAKQIIAENTTAYDSISSHFSATRQYNWQEIKKITDTYIKPNHSVLDLGCGNGRLLSILPNHIIYHGLDISASLIKEAKKYSLKHRKTNQNISFQVGNLIDLDPLGKKYDYIIAIASIHHIPSDQLRNTICQKISSLLKPKGIFICSNWQLNQKKYRPYCNFTTKKHPDLDQNDCLIPWKNIQGKIIAQRYYHSFSEEEIKRLVENSGFKILENYTEKFNIITVCRKLL